LDSEKEKLNWSRLLITTGLILATAAIVGGGVWYFMNQNETAQTNSYNDTVNSLQKQIDELKTAKAAASATTTTDTTATTTTLTNDQIFTAVSTALGLDKSQIQSRGYFRIFGQDKVQYNVGGGPVFAYKASGVWTKIPDNGTAVIVCSALTNVPSNYRPLCSDSSNSIQNADSSGASLNYPSSSMVSYINQ
jgi:hypothetical protein